MSLKPQMPTGLDEIAETVITLLDTPSRQKQGIMLLRERGLLSDAGCEELIRRMGLRAE